MGTLEAVGRLGVALESMGWIRRPLEALDSHREALYTFGRPWTPLGCLGSPLEAFGGFCNTPTMAFVFPCCMGGDAGWQAAVRAFVATPCLAAARSPAVIRKPAALHQCAASIGRAAA